MSVGFASLQHAENAVIPELLRGAGVDWLVEFAPASSPSPAIDVPRHRVLHDSSGWIWPFRADGHTLPFADESLPAVLVRHLFWDDLALERFAEALRVLAPGGLIVSVTANPWHRGSWRELGRDTFRLPAWPRFLYLHARHDLLLQIPTRRYWTSVLPGLSPLLLVVGRKPPRAATVRRLDLRRGFASAARAAPTTTCRAA
ncbi:class I SAM-dependent methyltransferase [Wenzhouxiangella sp. XN79A]|uniref:class I SAM-dependent methyltransferase n=1 Tax=Wenzhouxiangella sp. XN79A TaxID=2724193 RepID=UPI00144A9C32|nr:class I SAM-dependent methyltransferase [Wenzhouxiangella sp. XN79A]NKI33675.1 class I SAM-dependent methyltransferase [Wenzhouxiangella sp. XN79A]